MKKKLLSSVFIFSFSIALNAQHEADKWFFGSLAGLDFSGGAPVAISGSLSSAEGTAAISSATGTLLFYTEGVTVWDGTNSVMPNGNGLMGDPSTTQSALIVPSLTSSSQYYLFTLAADGGSAGFRYSLVDMTLNGGLGDVTATKNMAIVDSVTEKLCAVKDNSGNGYWVMVHRWGNNQFYAYHLTASGLSAPVISSVGSVHIASPTAFQNTYGQMKFNNCGDKLALAMGYLDMAELFDFNNSTGIVSNAINLPMSYHTYGVEFSKTSDLLYVTSYDPGSTLNQFNITLGTQPLIFASKTGLSTTPDLYALQMGPDGKIYVAESFGSPFLGVINNPDVIGTGANYSDNGILLDPNGNGVMGGLGLPSFTQDYLKQGAVCTVGINENSEESVKIFPNPGKDIFTIESTQDLMISIYDYTGKLIEQKETKNSGFSFGENLTSGVYFVSCLNGSSVHTFKIVKL
jgi:hypothetical protein